MTPGKLLTGARVYLSGPMDFVASRAYEKKYSFEGDVLDPSCRQHFRLLTIDGELPDRFVEVRKVMRGHRIVDARNLLDPTKVRAAGLDYVGMGRPLA